MNAFTILVLSGIGLLLALRGANREIREQQGPSPFSGQFTDTTVGPRETTLDGLYKKHAARKGLEWELVKAIAIVESNENPNAINPADPSMGLMQVFCMADVNGRPTNRFNIDGWPPKRCDELLNPDYNLHIATQILSWNIRTYGFKRGIAVYNRWKSRLDPENGPFGNQRYVDKVLKEYAGLKTSAGGIVV